MRIPVHSIARTAPLLEIPDTPAPRAVDMVRPATSKRGHLRTARLRLLVAIPAATVIWALAAGVLGLEIFQTFEKNLDPAAFNRAQMALIAGLIAIACLAALTGLAVTRSVFRPLAALENQLTAIADGHPAPAVPRPEPNELGELSLRFHSMLRALQQQAQDRSQVIMEQFAGALITTDGEGCITALNSAASEMLGVDRSEAIGAPVLALLEADDANADAVHHVGRLLLTGEAIQSRELNLKTRGSAARQVALSGTAHLTPEGRIGGAVVNMRDVGQIQAFHERVKQSEQFAALSTFAAGVAHEIRNPLASIKAIAQLLGEERDPESRIARYLSVIDAEVNRLGGIVTELQAFTHAGRAPQGQCDLNGVVRGALALAQHRLGGDTSAAAAPVTEELGSLPPVRAHSERLLQALFHVVLNALEAADGRGEVWIRTRSDGDSAVVEVENSGSSIAPEIRGQIFTPFFTTKAAGPGLGLAVARQILNQHQGSIELIDGVERVLFRVTLPVSEEARL
jgi:PAS domain S-box-containing protein